MKIFSVRSWGNFYIHAHPGQKIREILRVSVEFEPLGVTINFCRFLPGTALDPYPVNNLRKFTYTPKKSNPVHPCNTGKFYLLGRDPQRFHFPAYTKIKCTGPERH
jgi:hypothetical protein